jgi:hypothetical protein
MGVGVGVGTLHPYFYFKLSDRLSWTEALC